MGHSRPLAAWKVAMSTASPEPSGWSDRAVSVIQARNPVPVGSASTPVVVGQADERCEVGRPVVDAVAGGPSTARRRGAVGARPSATARSSAAELQVGDGGREVAAMGLQVAQRRLDLGLIEQAAAAPHPERDARLVQGPLDDHGLGVGAHQHGLGRPGAGGTVVVADGPGDAPRLGASSSRPRTTGIGPSGRLAPSAEAGVVGRARRRRAAPPASTVLATARIWGDER